MGHYSPLFCLKNPTKNYMTFICVIPLTVVRGSNFDTCKTVGNPVQETMLNVKVLNWGFLKAENLTSTRT